MSKRWNLDKKQWTSYGVQSVDPFPIEKLHQFKRNWILGQKMTSTEMKNFKKCNFRDRNDRIWLKNEESPGESFPLTCFQTKSSTNLPQTKFWCQKQNDDRNDRIWLKSDEPLTESNLLTHFQSKSSTNLPQTKFWHQKQNDDRNENFEKNAMSDAETMEFGRKMMNLF